jgi:hypothetical protein
MVLGTELVILIEPVGSDSVGDQRPQPTSIRLPAEQRQILEQEAARRNVPLAVVIREGLLFWCGWLASQRGDKPPGYK